MKHLLCLTLCLAFTIEMYCKTYNIVEYGAQSDTTVLSTVAIQRAIDECSLHGGGTVLVPAGKYAIGSIVLKSHVNLFLEHGAILYGSTDLKDYIKFKPSYLSLRTQQETIQLIYAEKATDIMISGSGTIDGRGKSFKRFSNNDEGIYRPHLLRFIECSDITVNGISLRNAGCWMQHYLACDRMTISHIKIYNRCNYNNDAIDIDGCHEVVISDVIADSDDDGITLKSTSSRLCENVNIANCVVSSHCNAIKLGTETNGGFKNINIHGITIKPSYDQGSKFNGYNKGISAISLEIVDGGTMDNVIINDITVMGTMSPIFIRLGNRARGYYKGQNIRTVGTIKNISIDHVRIIDAANYGCSITGLPQHPVENITLSNIYYEQQGGCDKVAIPSDEKEKSYPEATMWGCLPAKGFFVRHAQNIRFINVVVTTIQPDTRPCYVRKDVN